MSDRVQAVERALALLEVIAASHVPPTAPELAKLAGVNRATAWRLLNTLVAFDLVERNELDGRYTIGYGAVRIAAAAGTDTLVRRARPVLERIAAETRGSAFLEVPAHGELVVLDEARSGRAIQVDLAGMRIPLHCGSVGKLYLASLPLDDLETYLAGPLAALTEFTVTDPDALREEIIGCRASGVATNYQEHTLEWCGISAAVRDDAGHDEAYVNVTLPTYDTTVGQLRALSGVLASAAREIHVRIHPS
jgi:DNA-binding IclR family transcriptional regulator